MPQNPDVSSEKPPVESQPLEIGRGTTAGERPVSSSVGKMSSSPRSTERMHDTDVFKQVFVLSSSTPQQRHQCVQQLRRRVADQ